jgi:hypothetical protein
MPNYVEIIGEAYPDAQVVVRGNKDPSVYADIEWITTPISQATLDAHEYATIGVPSGTTKQFTFGDSEGNPLETKAASFTRVRTFQCEGSGECGVPIKIRLTAWMDDGNTGEFRLYDVTNKNIICTATITNDTEAMVDTTNISNWPNSLSLVEIQMRRKTGNSKKYVHLSGMTLIF